MPMVRAMRLLNSIEAGTTTGAQLQAQLVNGGVQSDFNSIMQLPGQCTVLAASLTALTAINLSPIATNLTAVGIPSNFALSRNPTARSFLFSSATNLLTACVVAAPQNWYPYSTWTRAFGAGLNNVFLGSAVSLGNFMAFGNGVYVTTSGSTSRNVYTSTDGLSWTLRLNALPVQAGGRWMGVRFGNGVFIAVSGGTATSTTAATSTDGITWTTQTLPLAEWVNLDCGLVSGTFTWVATTGGTTNSNVTARSTDNGATWVAGGNVSSSRWCSITYINGVFITVPGSLPFLDSIGASTGWRSTDGGVSWVAFGLPTSVNWTGVAATPSVPTRWIAVNNSGNNMAWSTDSGVTWNDLGTGADGGTCFIIATGNGLITYNKYSDNGITWTNMPAGVTNENNSGSCSAIFANGFVRNLGTSSPRFFSYSQLNPSSTGFFYGFSNSFKPTCALTVGTTYYQFGYAGYYSSTDQVTWTFTVVPAFTTLGGPVSVATNGTGTFIAVFGGANGATQNNSQFARSTDNGATWSFVTVPRNTQWVSIAFGAGNFVAVAGQPNPSINGGTSTGSNDGVYSTDNGATWSTCSLNPSVTYSQVAFLNGTFIVVGGNTSQVFYSTNNGVSFNSGASFSTTPGRQIAFAQIGGVNTWCVLSSNNSTMTISLLTGATYPVTFTSSVNIGTETQGQAITYNNGFFFAATNYATGNSIWSSVNGTTWTRTALPTEAVRPSNFLNTPGPTGILYYNTSVAASPLGTYNI